MQQAAAIWLSSAFLFFCDCANAQNYLSDLGAVAPALGINNTGQAVLQNYLYSGGTLIPFPSNFTGAAINASGQVAGSVSQTLAGALVYPYAGIYSNGTVTNLPPAYSQTDDLTPGMTATGINDNGQVIGYVMLNSNPPGGWLYSNGAMQGVGGPFNDTPCLGSIGIPESVNDSDDVAGALA
jgi:probable HAF family extracellular repeat protein